MDEYGLNTKVKYKLNTTIQYQNGKKYRSGRNYLKI